VRAPRRGGALRAGILAIALATGALSTIAPGRALGQEAKAASLFRAGSAAYERGDYAAAAVAFEEAHRRAPRAATIYNVALAWQAAGELGRAGDAFEACIAFGGLEPSSLEDARARLRVLDPQLGVVRITGPDGYVASLAHVSDAALPRRIRLRPGDYEVRARAPDGGTFTRPIAVRAGTTLEVSFEPPAATPPAKAPELQRTLGWVALGTGVAFGLATAGLGVAALDARDRFAQSNYTDRDARADADTLRTWTNISLVAAAVFSITGVVLILTAPKSGVASAQGRVVLPVFAAWKHGL
jgi:hypothetical protein